MFFILEILRSKKTILILLNELRHQISVQCKERGETLSKLWHAYFTEIRDEASAKFQTDQDIKIELLTEIKSLKEMINVKNKQ